MTINWNPANKITTLEVSPTGTPTIKYKAKFRQESQDQFDELHEIMRSWPEETWDVDDNSSQIKFVDNKLPNIEVTKKVKKDKKFRGKQYINHCFFIIISIICKNVLHR